MGLVITVIQRDKKANSKLLHLFPGSWQGWLARKHRVLCGAQRFLAAARCTDPNLRDLPLGCAPPDQYPQLLLCPPHSLTAINLPGQAPAFQVPQAGSCFWTVPDKRSVVALIDLGKSDMEDVLPRLLWGSAAPGCKFI